MNIGWLSTQFMHFMTSEDFVWLHGNIKFKKKMNFFNDSSSKTTVSSIAIFSTAYQKSLK